MNKLSKAELQYDDFAEYHPVADELVFYFDQSATNEDVKALSSEQLASLVSFGSIFGIGSDDFWKLISDALNDKKVIHGLNASDTINIMNTMKRLGKFSPFIHMHMIRHLSSMATQMSDKEISVTLLMLNHEDTHRVFSHNMRGQMEQMMALFLNGISKRTFDPIIFG